MRLPTAGMLLCAVLCDSQTLAQTVFFDDFDGTALQPHWSTPPPSHWEYDVSGGMLNVPALLYPSVPHIGYNRAAIGAPFASQGNFQMDVWMGWDAGDRPHRLAMYVLGSQGQILADFGYVNEVNSGPEPLIYAHSSGVPSVTALAPPPGIHHFRISRTASQFQFFLNENLFAVLSDGFGIAASGITLEFVGPYPGQLGPLHVDRVQIIPSPAGMLMLAWFWTYRRRARPS